MAPPPPKLSPRQHQVMQGLVDHKRSKTIADELGVSPKTVDSYIGEVVALLGARDRADATLRYKSLYAPESDPGKIPGEFIRVAEDAENPPVAALQPTGSGRGLERFSRLQRLVIIVILSLALAFGLALAAVAVVGWIALYDTVPRAPTRTQGGNMSETATGFGVTLKRAELACDDALTHYAEMLVAAQAVNRGALKFGEAQPVLADLTEAMALQVRARHHLARAHAKALEIGERHSIVPVGFGDTVPTYDEARDAPTASVTPLRSVA